MKNAHNCYVKGVKTRELDTIKLKVIQMLIRKEYNYMRHVMALVIKTIMVSAVLIIVMSIMNNYPVGSTFVLALLVSGLAYLAGDLGVLPISNNTVATVADFGLATLTIWLVGPFIVEAFIPFTIALLSGVVIAAGEWFFHKYMTETVLPRKDAL